MSAARGARRAGRCAAQVDPGDPALPVAGRGSLARVRRSTRSRWRALVLLGVHLLIAAHVTHYLLAGRTLSPVEPSETMYTLERGQINAGFLFLLVALLATVIFGRFFCGWGCHLVALQDLCGWAMKRLGLRPRPFRSRLLLLVPLALALYMFAWPTLRRLLFGGAAGAFPGWSNHLLTDRFWATFPGPLFAGLTFLVCGFLAVYFLGAKGFCTYGCPYGALFVIADRFSPGRIRVTEDCEQCGHCSVTCTSNVAVHDEVRRYGMVVDPGCMKCMDCISVCPKNALYFGFGRPRLLAQPPTVAPGPRRYALSWPEEAGVALVALGATWAFRGLYDGPPLLMAVGLGGLSAFAALQLWRVFRRPTVRLQQLELKSGGRMRRSGWLFAALAGVWLAFALHSGYVQWHRQWGRYHLDRTEAGRAEVFSGRLRPGGYSAAHRMHAERAFRHFARADRAGLFGVVEVKLGLAWIHLLRREPGPALSRIDEALALAPHRAALYEEKISLLEARGEAAQAADALRRKLEAVPAEADDYFRLGGLLVQSEQRDAAVEAYRRCIALAPDSAAAHYNLGGLLRRLGRLAEARGALRAAARLAPDDADTQIELGLVYMNTGEAEAAVAAFERAIALAPDSPESRLHLPRLIEQLRRGTGATPS